jgi:hypothetical protein
VEVQHTVAPEKRVVETCGELGGRVREGEGATATATYTHRSGSG